MSPELAKNALQFMARVQLTGAEVPAFQEVVAALVAIAQPAPSKPIAVPDAA